MRDKILETEKIGKLIKKLRNIIFYLRKIHLTNKFLSC
jgi:hypothetical protein